MEYEHFGFLLQELRKKYNMSRDKLAQNICTPKQIYRIEKGISEPSVYILHQLSIKFNLDLNEYYKVHFSTNTITGLEGINSINSAIEQRDYQLLKSLIKIYDDLEDFKKGENLQHIYYGKALCSALLENDYTASLKYCYKGIRIECPAFNIDRISNNMFSNVGITLVHCLSLNLFAMNQYMYGMKVLTGLLKVLETYILDSPYPMYQATQFSKKLYQLTLYNIGVNLFDHGEIDKAQYYIDKGMEYFLKEYNLRHLPNLLYMKFKILYSKQKYKEAQGYYNYAYSLYKLTDKKDIITNLDNTARISFPEMFN